MTESDELARLRAIEQRAVDAWHRCAYRIIRDGIEREENRQASIIYEILGYNPSRTAIIED